MRGQIKTESINLTGQPIGHISNGQNEADEAKETKKEEPAKTENNTENSFENEDAGGPQASERRGRIIDFIKRKDWVSVGELAEVFRGETSEKTIQRDLAGMAGEGLLLKEGEKRWRKYKLAQ